MSGGVFDGFVVMFVEGLASLVCSMRGILVRIAVVAGVDVVLAGPVGILGVLVGLPTGRCETLGMLVEREMLAPSVANADSVDVDVGVVANAGSAPAPAPAPGSDVVADVEVSETVCSASRGVTTLPRKPEDERNQDQIKIKTQIRSKVDISIHLYTNDVRFDKRK